MSRRSVHFRPKSRRMTINERFARLSLEREQITIVSAYTVIIVSTNKPDTPKIGSSSVKTSRKRPRRKNPHKKEPCRSKDERDWDCRPSTIGEVTEEELDRELDDYFRQDRGRTRAKLDKDLEEYGRQTREY